MLLGFISLLLTVGTTYVAKICIPANFGDVMLPCKLSKEKVDGGSGGGGGDDDDDGGDRRKLLSYIYADHEEIIWRRALASVGKEEYCSTHVIN